jgi:hypothetical protein
LAKGIKNIRLTTGLVIMSRFKNRRKSKTIGNLITLKIEITKNTLRSQSSKSKSTYYASLPKEMGGSLTNYIASISESCLNINFTCR